MFPNTICCTFTAVPASSGNAIGLAVIPRPVAVEGAEHTIDGKPQLDPGIGGERLTDFGHFGLQPARELLQPGRIYIIDAALAQELLLHTMKPRVVNAQDDVSEHLHKPAVAIPRKPSVAGGPCERLRGLPVQPEIEHGVHHAGHGYRGARPHTDEQRRVRGAKGTPRLLFKRLHRLVKLGLESIRPCLGTTEEGSTRLGRKGKPWRNWEAQASHLGEACALTSEKRLVGAFSVLK